MFLSDPVAITAILAIGIVGVIWLKGWVAVRISRGVIEVEATSRQKEDD